MTSASEVIQAMGIGASEIAAVVDISPHMDRWDLFASKKGLVEREHTEEMFWGKMLEPVIARVFSERMGLPIQWWDKRLYSKERPWQYASPDALILTTPTEILECKTAGFHQLGHWDRDSDNEDGVPDHYVAQVQWQMTVCSVQVAYIAVLIAGQDFRVYKIPHDPVLEDILVEEGEKFWREHLMTDVAPPVGGSERARQYLRRHFPREREKLRPATLAETEMLDQYAQLRRLLDQGEDRRKELENQITQAIGEAEGLEWQRGKFTWKRTKDRHFVNWEGLAKAQIARFTEAEQKEFITEYTRTEPGYRRIHWREEEEKAYVK